METILNFFKKSKLKIDIDETEDHFILISGVLVEAAAIDGKIDEIEILKIKRSLINFLEISEEKCNHIVNTSLKKVDNPNSLHYFTSTINKKLEYDKKLELLEILWGIILADGKIHDFESNLVRRLSGLLYVSDIDCGIAKKRASTKN